MIFQNFGHLLSLAYLPPVRSASKDDHPGNSLALQGKNCTRGHPRQCRSGTAAVSWASTCALLSVFPPNALLMGAGAHKTHSLYIDPQGAGKGTDSQPAFSK